jgi:nitroimidazol reductase NimA-like FMN-containing flavoprotein (pyridoxamine 5'-phosphate oxidase superfamily)
MNEKSHGARHEPDGGPARLTVDVDVDDQSRDLSHPQCWELLGESGIGHLALRAQPEGVDVVPINYLVHDRVLYFRSAPGTKLMELVEHPHVAVQIERLGDGLWSSVVVKGRAQRLARDDEIIESGVMTLVTSAPGEKSNYVRVTPEAITGRSFPAR